MAKLYEFEVSREALESIAQDVGLTLVSGAQGNIIDNLLNIIDRPSTFQKVSMDGKPGICLRVGQIQTERFEGEGLHMFTHSGSEGYLETIEFDRRLKASLEKLGIPFTERT